jgi:pimeloyl-ACP methyl ester carboxylesterase
MFFTSTDNRNLFYELKGNTSSNNTIVFLNGLSQSTVAWSFMLPFFEDYKILLLDFIFQGQSDKHGEFKNFDEHALDVISLMQYLKIEQAHVCGISYGSLVAQNIATTYPYAVKKLILLSTFAHKSEYFKAVELSWLRAVEMGGYNMLLDVMLPFVLGQNFFENPLIPIDLLKQSRQGVNENNEALMKLMRATAERADYRAELHKIIAPTLIVHGRFDKLITMDLAEEVQRNIPNATLKVIEQAGHTLNLEAVQETSLLMQDFLSIPADTLHS